MSYQFAISDVRLARAHDNETRGQVQSSVRGSLGMKSNLIGRGHIMLCINLYSLFNVSFSVVSCLCKTN